MGRCDIFWTPRNVIQSYIKLLQNTEPVFNSIGEQFKILWLQNILTLLHTMYMYITVYYNVLFVVKYMLGSTAKIKYKRQIKSSEQNKTFKHKNLQLAKLCCGIIIVCGDQCSWLSFVTLADEFSSPRTYLIIPMLIGTKLRTGEFCQQTYEHWRLNKNDLTVYGLS